MRTNLLKFSSGLLFTLLMAVVFFTGSSATYAQAQTRSFQMGLWTAPKGPDSDIAVFWGNQPQPPGLSIWVNYPSPYENLNTVYTDGNNQLPAPIDWSRIVAIEMDEPYASIDGTFIAPGGDCSSSGDPTLISPIDTALQQRAAELKALAPKARFWVNFTWIEASWIAFCTTPLAVNRAYIDVFSFDWYNTPLDPLFSNLGQAYAIVFNSRPKPDQQLALIPGVYSAPQSQEGYLQGYFDYANNNNQSCNLPLGSRGVTGIFDGCPVWIVLGWLSNDCTPANCGGTAFSGMLDGSPASTAIRREWDTELQLNLSPNLAHQRLPEQIVQPILQLLLRPH